jgi:hypothetical protein
MIKSRKAFIFFGFLLLAIPLFLVGTVTADEVTIDSKKIERLERLIREQQQLELSQQQVNQLKQTAAAAEAQAKEAKTTVQAPAR